MRLKLMTILIIFCLCHGLAYGIPEDLAVRCICGEASGEPVAGQIAVGEVLRRRGSVKGFVGCHAGGKPTAKELKRARVAWRRSRWTNYSRGATNFDSTDFKKPWWSYGMRKVCVIGKHCFWKKV